MKKYIEFRKKNNLVFPYSTAHLQEILYISEREELEKHLDCLSKISNNLLLKFEWPDELIIEHTLSPHDEIYNTANSVLLVGGISETVNTVPNEYWKKKRQEAGAFPIVLNNFEPSEVILQMDNIFREKFDTSFVGIMEEVANQNSISADSLYYMASEFFWMLDTWGYQTDKHTPKSNMAIYWDSKHTAFASTCDYFISDDRRTRKKAKVVYHHFNINTKILPSRELMI